MARAAAGTSRTTRLRRTLSVVASAAAIVAIFAAAALLGALVAHATSPSPERMLGF